MKVFGFEQVESPKFDFKVIWLKLGSSMFLHLIERDPITMLPESPWSSMNAVVDPKNLPRGHHVCFYVPDFDSFVQKIKVLLMKSPFSVLAQMVDELKCVIVVFKCW